MEKELSFSELYDSFDGFMKSTLDWMNDVCMKEKFGIATPELLMLAMLNQPQFLTAFEHYCSNTNSFYQELLESIEEIEKIPDGVDEHCVYSHQLMLLLQMATIYSQAAEAPKVKASHVIYAMYELEESVVAYLLKRFVSDKVDFMTAILDLGDPTFSSVSADGLSVKGTASALSERLINVDEMLDELHPMVGREDEMEQLTQILCRKDAHHALLVGEIGVGKSTIVYELAKRMKEGLLPERFSGGKFFKLNLKSLLEGVQTRADLDRRLTDALQTIPSEGKTIVFVEQMQSLTSSFAKQNDESDVVSLLKPYLDWDNFRFIGACTPNDYIRNFSEQKRFSKYFQKIDVEEPSVEDSIKILNAVLPDYEAYHKVHYDAESVSYAVNATYKHIHNRFLPQKAIALLDDAGAYLVSHPDAGSKVVDVQLLSKLLSKVCKNDSLLMDGDGSERLLNLESRILSKIYGQDEAVRLIVESVQMSKAGLLEDNKPLASFLFVGPTGVGKTEVANVLAKELGVELVRFDMSEYVEQFTVSKLIGSPAGYVGYDEGGLLTEAIRKNPNCVLLLDEIEKAHDSIYNILLQVMDYARLTDNKGNHADFRNVVLIMTSNAGAQYAWHASIGFSSTITAGDVMMKQVKKTFKPEFLNRLTASVLFNAMDKSMAERVLDKKLDILQQKLSARNVEMKISEEAHAYLLEQGFSKSYGAREMDRVISMKIKPLLTREILFGKLKNGGVAQIELQSDKLVLL